MLSLILHTLAIFPASTVASTSGLAPATPGAPTSTISLLLLERRRTVTRVLPEIYLLRGGAQYSRGGGKTNSKKNKHSYAGDDGDEDVEDDEYDEDEEEEVEDDDDEEEEDGSNNEASDVSEGSENEEEEEEEEEGGSDYEIAAWKSNKAPSQSIAMSSLGARLFAEAQGLAARGQAAVRDAKGYFSSDFEALLLAATKPNDSERPPDASVSHLLESVGTFARNFEPNDPTNPYRVTLRKLWAKLAEKNWRTTLKALYLLHSLASNVEPEDAVLFRHAYEKLAKETDRRTGVKYFSLGPILDIGLQPTTSGDDDSSSSDEGSSDDGRALPGSRRKGESRWTTLTAWANAEAGDMAPFVEAYARYVLRRLRAFTAQFEELRLLGKGSRLSGDAASAQLLKAKKLVHSGLAVGAALNADAESGVSLGCLELTANDALVLFPLFHAKVAWIASPSSHSIFKGWDKGDVTELLASFTEARDASLPQVQAFLKTSSDLLELYGGVDLPVDLLLEP